MDEGTNRGGVGFCGLLAILFTGLKLAGCIDWPWAAVLAPIWVPFAVAVLIMAVLLVVACSER